jgi:hypothetical protein
MITYRSFIYTREGTVLRQQSLNPHNFVLTFPRKSKKARATAIERFRMALARCLPHEGADAFLEEIDSRRGRETILRLIGRPTEYWHGRPSKGEWVLMAPGQDEVFASTYVGLP